MAEFMSKFREKFTKTGDKMTESQNLLYICKVALILNKDDS